MGHYSISVSHVRASNVVLKTNMNVLCKESWLRRGNSPTPENGRKAVYEVSYNAREGEILERVTKVGDLNMWATTIFGCAGAQIDFVAKADDMKGFHFWREKKIKRDVVLKSLKKK